MSLTVVLLLLSLPRVAAARGGGCPACGVASLPPGAQRDALLALAKQSILAKLRLPGRPGAPRPPNRGSLRTALRAMLRDGGAAPGTLRDGFDTPGMIRDGSDTPGMIRDGDAAPGMIRDGFHTPGMLRDGSNTPGMLRDGDAIRDGSATPGMIRDGDAAPGMLRDGFDTPGMIRGATPGMLQDGSDTPGLLRDGSDTPGMIRDGSGTPGMIRDGSDIPGTLRHRSDTLGMLRDGDAAAGMIRDGAATPGMLRDGSNIPGMLRDGSDTPGMLRDGDAAPGMLRDGSDTPRMLRDGSDTPGMIRDGAASPGMLRDGSASPGMIRDGSDTPGMLRDGADTPGMLRDGSASAGMLRDGSDTPGMIRDGSASPGTLRDGAATPGMLRDGDAAPEMLRDGSDTPGTLRDGRGTGLQQYELLSFAESGSSTSRSVHLHFRFSQEVARSTEVQQATLYLFWASPGTHAVTIRLLQPDPAGPNLTVTSETRLEARGPGWTTLDVAAAVQNLFTQDTPRLTVRLEVPEGRESHLPSLHSDSHRPFVVAKAHSRSPHRVRRRGVDCGADSRMCCRREFFVDFKEIGWEDWIIQPAGYHMNYCSGLCPLHMAGIPGLAASFHTAVLNRIKAASAAAAVDSCCVPTQRRPLSLLYYDRDSNIVKTDIPDMIVDSCGCT